MMEVMPRRSLIRWRCEGSFSSLSFVRTHRCQIFPKRIIMRECLLVSWDPYLLTRLTMRPARVSLQLPWLQQGRGEAPVVRSRGL